MAKGKKSTSALTSEEKLQAALVPIEEYPYKIPQNWQWVRLNNLVSIVTGKKDANYGSDNGKYFFFTCASEPLRCDDYSFEGESLLLPGNGANVGEVFYYDGKFEAYQRTYVIQKLSDEIDMRYLYYQILGFWKDYNKDKQYGSATNYIKLGNFLNYNVPIAPRAEQQRIVEKIESLFSKLDEAKEKAQNAIDSYDMRVKSILDKAFRGEYSKKWRDNNKVSLEDWTDSHINEVCIPRAGFAFDSKKFTSEGYQVIRMGNLYAGELDLTRSPVFIAKEDVDNNVLSRSLVHDGDILITLTGTKYKRDYGYAVCIEGNPELLVNQRILCLTPTEKIDKDYLLFYLRSEGFRDIFFSCETGGVNQGNVSSKFVENIELKLPSIEEQRVIASLLKDIMDKEDQAKEISIGIVDEIDIMKKSILAKAFKGELGTNDSSDEPAEELLKRILTEVPVEEKKKSTTRKTKVKVVMNKDMLEAVREAGKITPERLKEETGLGIDEFYEELKRLIGSGQVSEKKEDGDVYLEVGDAN